MTSRSHRARRRRRRRWKAGREFREFARGMARCGSWVIGPPRIIQYYTPPAPETIYGERLIVRAEDEFIRASGDCICPACGKDYYHHPHDPGATDWEGHPFLHVLCDGTRVKL